MTELIAKDGGWLTQAILEDETSRIFVHKVLTPNADLWMDVTSEEKATWESEHPTDFEDETING